MNIQERIEALETEFNEKIKALKAEVSQEKEFPQDGDEYWYIDDEGDILNEKWDGLDFEEYRLEIGNIYKTEDEAEFAVDKLKVEAELRKFSRPFKRDSLNFVMCFDTEEDKLYGETRRFMNQGSLYFDWGQVARAVDEVGEGRIKKFIFGVED
ncbi:hypothetical protein [Aerococcus sp. L_32]|uniref:hypothetical protein n=1 Tax=Aerococcus sp. L_32 TaxID=3422316 RepID=UPI003D6A284A